MSHTPPLPSQMSWEPPLSWLKSTYSCGVPQFATHREVAPEGHVAMAWVKLSGTHEASHWCGSLVPFSPVYSRQRSIW